MTRYLFDPAIANTVGVLGIIPVTLGGTGANTADNAASSLGFIKASTKNQANGVAGLDSNGKVSIDNLPSSINSASEAAKLTTARTITLSGDVTGNVNFDGSANVEITTTVGNDSHTHAFDNLTTKPTTLSGYGITDAISSSAKGAANGVAPLGADSKVPTANLPSTIASADQATKLATARDITLTGDVTGTTSFDGTGNVSITATGVQAAKLTTARNISLSGDVTGTTSFDGSGNVTIAATVADDSHFHAFDNITGTPTTLSGYGITDGINTSAKGAANGVATLDSNGLVPSTQLPSYVDDVLEFADLASFPGTGVVDKIYVALDTNKCYRWSGSAYIFITSGAVDSVMGATGVVTATNLGLQNFTAGATVSGTHTGSSSGTNTGDETTSSIKSKLDITTLSGDNTGDQTITLTGDATGSGTGSFAVTLATITDSGTGSFKKITTNSKGLVTGTAAVAQSDITGLLGNGSISDAMLANGAVANLSGTNTGDQTITLTGDATGSGTGSFAVTLANSGAVAGTYKSVTINAKGLVTSGTNPTTLSGYGITDAIPASEKGAASGVAELDNKGVIKSSHLPFAAMMFLMAPL